jgi:hypothetical protein
LQINHGQKSIRIPSLEFVSNFESRVSNSFSLGSTCFNAYTPAHRVTHLIRFDKRGRRILGGVLAAMLLSGVSHGQTNRLIFQETFETYKTVKALRAAWPGPAQLVTNAPGGGQCVALDGTGANRRGGFFVFPDATHNLVLSADFYDSGTNTNQNVTISINGDDTHDNVSMGLKGAFCYVAHVGGFSSRTNWIPFKRRQLPVVGWHRFQGSHFNHGCCRNGGFRD